MCAWAPKFYYQLNESTEFAYSFEALSQYVRSKKDGQSQLPRSSLTETDV